MNAYRKIKFISPAQTIAYTLGAILGTLATLATLVFF